ncbi:MAG: transposase [Clostridia bacterium]|nr:transposase [Clostridia bacterium]
MSRKSRKDLNTPFLHIMVQGVNKEYIFNKKDYIIKYLELIQENKKEFEVTIIAYCIMNNHAHFLVYTENIEKFGKYMQKINLNYAQMYNKTQNRCGILFRNRYQAEPIYDKKYLINCIKYIHDNPVKAGIVKKCEDYKYSSYNNYMNNAEECTSPIMQEIFGKNCNYELLFKRVHDIRFMDDKESYNNSDEYIIGGIEEFIIENKICVIDIFQNRKLLIKLIFFLKQNCNIKYNEIRNYLDIPRGTMENLKKK